MCAFRDNWTLLKSIVFSGWIVLWICWNSVSKCDGCYPIRMGENVSWILGFSTSVFFKKKKTIYLLSQPIVQRVKQWNFSVIIRRCIRNWNKTRPSPYRILTHPVSKFLEEYFTRQRTKYYLVPGQKQQI